MRGDQLPFLLNEIEGGIEDERNCEGVGEVGVGSEEAFMSEND